APVWMFSAQGDHPLLHRRGNAGGMVGRPVGKRGQGRIAPLRETRLPIIEGAPSDMGDATSLLHVACRLPRLEEQAPLGGGGLRKVRTRHSSSCCTARHKGRAWRRFTGTGKGSARA